MDNMFRLLFKAEYIDLFLSQLSWNKKKMHDKQ